MTPRERYQNDPTTFTLVKLMISEIEMGRFTSTEMMEAALLAHIIYTETHVGWKVLPLEIKQWLDEPSNKGSWNL
jgi:hypothetical protein